MRGKIVLGFVIMFVVAIATQGEAAKVVYSGYGYHPYYYPYAAPVVPTVVQSHSAPSGNAQSASAQSAAINGVLTLLMDRLANRSGGGPANAGGSTGACQNLSASVEKLSNSVDKLNSLLSGVTPPANNGGGAAGGTFNPVSGGGLDAALKAAGAQGAQAQGASPAATIDVEKALDVLAKQENQKDRLDFLKWALANELIRAKAAADHDANVDALKKQIDAVKAP